MSVKINSLEFENVKRIKAVQLEPSKNGLKIKLKSWRRDNATKRIRRNFIKT